VFKYHVLALADSDISIVIQTLLYTLSVAVSVGIPKKLRDEAMRNSINISDVAQRALEEVKKRQQEEASEGYGRVAEGGEEREVGFVLDASAL
jgi:post-segregation antitoxin (ccd killing protein)